MRGQPLQEREAAEAAADYLREPMKIENGKTYVNGRGDVLIVEERTPGVFLDQHGGIYHPDGKQWNHIEGSTANLIAETDAAPEPRTAP